MNLKRIITITMMKFCYWLQVVNNFAVNKFQGQGSGCGSVGRVVASKARGTQFESCNRQIFTINIFTVICWKDENNEPGNGQTKNIFSIAALLQRQDPRVQVSGDPGDQGGSETWRFDWQRVQTFIQKNGPA